MSSSAVIQQSEEKLRLDLEKLKERIREHPIYEEFGNILFTDDYLVLVLTRNKNGKRRTFEYSLGKIQQSLDLWNSYDFMDLLHSHDENPLFPKKSSPWFIQGRDRCGCPILRVDAALCNGKRFEKVDLNILKQVYMIIFFTALKNLPARESQVLYIFHASSANFSWKTINKIMKIGKFAEELIPDRVKLTAVLGLPAIAKGTLKILLPLFPKETKAKLAVGGDKEVLKRIETFCDIKDFSDGLVAIQERYDPFDDKSLNYMNTDADDTTSSASGNLPLQNNNVDAINKLESTVPSTSTNENLTPFDDNSGENSSEPPGLLQSIANVFNNAVFGEEVKQIKTNQKCNEETSDDIIPVEVDGGSDVRKQVKQIKPSQKCNEEKSDDIIPVEVDGGSDVRKDPYTLKEVALASLESERENSDFKRKDRSKNAEQLIDELGHGNETETMHTEARRSNRLERFANSVVSRPKIWFCCSWGLIILLVFLTFSFGWFNPASVNVKLLEIQGSEVQNYADAFADAQKQVERNIPSRENGFRKGSFQAIMYWKDKSRSDSVITPRNLQLLCEFQRILTSHKDYPLFCLTGSNGANGLDTECIDDQPTSLISHFYNRTERMVCGRLSEDQFQMRLQNYINSNNAYALASDESYQTATRIRSDISLGGPLGNDTKPPGESFLDFDDYNNAKGKQYEAYSNFLWDKIEPQLRQYLGMDEISLFSNPYKTNEIFLGDESDGVLIKFYNQYMYFGRLEVSGISDGILSAFSSVAILILAYSQIGSLFLSLTALYAIFSSLFVALFLYRSVLQIELFTSLHIVLLFLFLGVGIDILFVFHEKWRRAGKLAALDHLDQLVSKEEKRKEMLKCRLAITMRAVFPIVLHTSISTMGAFLATAISNVQVVTVVGVYGAVIMFVLLMYTLFLYPSAFVINEMYFSKTCCFWFRKSPKLVDQDVEQEETRTTKKSLFRDLFFEKIYVPIMKRSIRILGYPVRPYSTLSVLILLVFFAIFASFAKDIKATDEYVTFSPGIIDRTFEIEYLDFQESEANGMFTDIVWGVESIDRSDVKLFADVPQFRGNVVFDSDFDLSRPETQSHILDVCNRLRKYKDVNKDAVFCPLENFVVWHNISYPGNISAIELGGQNKQLWIKRLKEFLSLIPAFTEQIGFIGDKNVYYSVKAQLTTPLFVSLQVRESVLNSFNDFILNDIRKTNITGLDSVFVTGIGYTFSKLENETLLGLIQGMLISLPIAFFVLLWVTRNIVVAVFATISLTGSVVFAIGISAGFLGFEIGIGEAIVFVFVIGLSVDYTIHLGSAFTSGSDPSISDSLIDKAPDVKSLQPNQPGQIPILLIEEKFTYASNTMGPTVIMAAVTTIASTFPLFFCSSDIFYRMGVLIVLSIVGSTLYSLFLFLPLCLISGSIIIRFGNIPKFNSIFKKHVQTENKNEQKNTPSSAELPWESTL